MNYYQDNSLVIGFAETDEWQASCDRVRIAQLEAVLRSVQTQIDDARRLLNTNQELQRPQVATCYLNAASKLITEYLK